MLGDQALVASLQPTMTVAPSRTASGCERDADPTQASVTEIVTHAAQRDVIGRNMALLRPCTFDIARDAAPDCGVLAGAEPRAPE